MRLRIALIAVALAVFSTGTQIAASSKSPAQVPVLLYHHLAPEAEAGNNAVIPVGEFRRQIDLLRAKGYRSITTAQLGDWLAGRGRLPAHPVLITFDDGYQSNYEHAYPILKRAGWKAALFLVTSKVGRTPGRYPYVTWDQLREMAASGVFEIQAHSHDGHREINGNPALITWTEKQIQADWEALQRELTDHGLPRATMYAYPFGAHDAETDKAMAANHVRLGFGGEPGHVRRGDDPFNLKRLTVYPGMSDCQFLAMVSGSGQQCETP